MKELNLFGRLLRRIGCLSPDNKLRVLHPASWLVLLLSLFVGCICIAVTEGVFGIKDDLVICCKKELTWWN